MTNDADWNYTDNMKPVADAGGDINQVYTKIVRLDASSSYDPDGKIVKFVWDFGDGQSAEGMTIDHTYNQYGTYNASLLVVDNDGATDTDEIQVTITLQGPGGSGGSFSPRPILELTIDAPDEITIAPGESKSVTISVKSTGQSDVYDVDAEVDGPNDWISKDEFTLGDIGSGKSKNFAFTIEVPEDEEEGEEIIRFKASGNNVKAKTVEMILNIKKPEEPLPSGEDGGESPTGLFLLDPNVIAGLVVILLVAIGAGYHYGKKGKTSKPNATTKTTQLEATSETPKKPESDGSGAEFSIEYK